MLSAIDCLPLAPINGAQKSGEWWRNFFWRQEGVQKFIFLFAMIVVILTFFVFKIFARGEIEAQGSNI